MKDIGHDSGPVRGTVPAWVLTVLVVLLPVSCSRESDSTSAGFETDARERGLNIVAGQVAQKDLSSRSNVDEGPEAQQDVDAALAAMDRCSSQTDRSHRTAGMPQLLDSYRTEVLGAQQVQDAQSGWSDCMAEAGYPVKSVSELVSSVFSLRQAQNVLTMSPTEFQEWKTSFFAKERDAALAVADCDRSAFTPAGAAWRELETQWLDRHAAEYRSLAESDRLLFGAAVGI